MRNGPKESYQKCIRIIEWMGSNVDNICETVYQILCHQINRNLALMSRSWGQTRRVMMWALDVMKRLQHVSRCYTLNKTLGLSYL